ncbi:MAG: hypothetical protein ABIP81_06165 [Terriglobales bacterium]
MHPLPKFAISRASSALVFTLVFTLVLASPVAAAPDPLPQKNQPQLADSMEKKIASVKENGAKERPVKRTTVFQQDEINAYFAERRLTMPDGVRSVVFALGPNQVRAQARIDFDDITRNRRTHNPLMYLFTGVHNVEVSARTAPSGACMVHVAVESVTIDGVTVPRMALQFFVDRFVSPKYPKVGLDRDYRLPAKMDAVVIAKAKGTVTQK